MAQYNVFTLDNGLRCVHIPSSGKAVYCGIAVNAGSSDDPAGKSGLAHFVEHTVFKGTKKRSSWRVNNRMEPVGGELNAYTTKEETLIYTNAPSGLAERSLELLSDLVKNSIFPHKEIDMEKEVVTEEINSYLDSPADSVFDEFEDRLYSGTPLGHNILGTSTDVKSISGEDCRRFVDELYVPENMAVYCMDPSPERKIMRYIDKYFSPLNHALIRNNQEKTPLKPVFREIIDKDGHQAHTLYGARTFSREDPRRFALFLLNNYLGGPGMNSRLNQELREKTGYVYTVDSSVSLYKDAGQLQIYFGCDRENVRRCERLIARELARIADRPMPQSALDRIKRQYIGQLRVGSDNREMSAMSAGKSLLYYGEIHDCEWTAERIMSVTAEELREVAELFSSDRCSVLTIE